ncbi:helix-turn-helix transcriptional regulator [Peribacillus simplex]|uniref:helix-turn-helix domain-containing protein n=1 Tax=Peribacillus simplex TaxID=1478 RepID=UPI003393F43C
MIEGANNVLTKRLQELRINHNLTQEQVANILGVTRTAYNMYEQGKRQMDYNALVKLAEHYNVSLDYLFQRTDVPFLNETMEEDELDFMLQSLSLYRDIKYKYK